MSDPETVARSGSARAARAVGRGATWLLSSALWPWPVRWALIAFLAWFTWLALSGPADPTLNLATVLIWVLWWPALAVSFLLVGRVWCGVCPMGALSDLTHRKLGLGLAVPRLFKNRWLVAVLLGFAILFQAWVEEVTRAAISPLVTGFILWAFTAGAVVSGLLYERWTWCHNLCPLGAWAGVFSMGGMMEVRADPEVCVSRGCKGMYCYFGRDERPGCPFKQVAKTMQSNRFCSMCGNCLKACPNGAISVRVRAPIAEVTGRRRSLTGSALVSVTAVGVVAFQALVMTAPWAWLRERVQDLPVLGHDAVLYGLFIAACVGAALGLYRLAGRRFGAVNGPGAEGEVHRFGLAMLPLALTAHIGHNLGHLFNGAALLPGATAVLLGGEPAPGLAESAPNTGLWQGVEIALVGLGLALSLAAVRAVGRKLAPAMGQPPSTAPYAALATVFALVYAAAFSLPMLTRVSA